MILHNLRMLLKSLFLFALVVVAVSTHAAERFNHEIWDSLLKKHVKEVHEGRASQVDYAGMVTEHKRLKRYLSSLKAVPQVAFDTWSKEDQLAFLINAYNAWTVELILTKFPDLESIKDLGSFFQSPWKKRFIPLLGETRSLDDIEHGLIRGSGRYKDPRVHFAANCASIGCPSLRAEAYVGDRLDEQLEDAARSFLGDRSRNRFDEGELKVSSIFKWYRNDFEKGWRGKHSLAQFLAAYADSLDLKKQQVQLLLQDRIDIAFLAYDWRLNRTH